MLTKITITIETEDKPVEEKARTIDKLMSEMTEEEVDKAIEKLLTDLFR